MSIEIQFQPAPAERRKSPPRKVEGFGAVRTNHMFVADYEDGAWKNPRVVAYGDFSVPPGATALHYGQEIFEGAKAFRHDDGELYAFRFDQNAERLNRSAEILLMPTVPVELQTAGLMRLLDADREWCPSEPESSMYIRPFMFGTQDTLGVKASSNYVYCIMLSPSGPYYAGGFSKAITLLVTKRFHRAVSGGTGAAKTGGNYAASLRAAEHAHSLGASQVLYLDASNTTIEEAGTMNHFHVDADGCFVIPEFNDSILRSITSVSVLELAKAGVVKARQEVIPIDRFLADIKAGRITEAGGFGTAAVVSPVGRYLTDDGDEYIVGDGGIGPRTRKLYEYYTKMQTGRIPAPEGWLAKVPHFDS